MYRRALGGSLTSWIDHLRVREGILGSPNIATAMDARLNTLCGHLKDRNVVIFGIAFEAPAHGANVIRNCASPDRFYDVEGLDITTAFRAIRSQITKLRLTQ